MTAHADLEIQDEPDGLTFHATGSWTVDNAGALFQKLESLTVDGISRARFRLSGIKNMDTAGAWLIYRTEKKLRQEGATVELTGINDDYAYLLKTVADNDRPCVMAPRHRGGIIETVDEIGKTTIHIGVELGRLVSYLGLVTITLLHTIVRPGRLRWTSLVYHMEQVGWRAAPIVGLMSFLLGIVIAQQGEFQLRQFGAQVFVVDLVSISILREIGILLTAILVAGRSGSAFTAQIGSMVLHEEVDAMRTLGLDPIELLVIPRLLALTIMLPLLTFFADLMGLLGGGVFVWWNFNIDPDTYIERINQSIDIWTFLVGISKAPVFAGIIAICGCFEGMSVKGSAESVGQRTTRSVVESIFLVIIFDALFSIFFTTIGI